MLKSHLRMAHHLGRSWQAVRNLPPSHLQGFPHHRLITDLRGSSVHSVLKGLLAGWASIPQDAGSSPIDFLKSSLIPPVGKLFWGLPHFLSFTAYCLQVKCVERQVNFWFYLLVHQLRFLSQQQLFLMDEFEPIHHEGILRLICKDHKRAKHLQKLHQFGSSWLKHTLT